MAGLTVIDNPAQLAEHLEAAAVVLRQCAPGRDWLDEVLDAGGDALKSDEAAYVADMSTDTMRRRAEAAADAGRPIAVLMAGAMWLFSERRLLNSIEVKEGKPARLEAESRARKSRDLRSSPQKSPETAVATAG
jgi:hypothetical protein